MTIQLTGIGSGRAGAVRALCVLCAALAASTAMTDVARAQSTVSQIRGRVADEAGAPVVGAEVTITDSRTGATRRVTTGRSGQFSANALSVGGPYIVTVEVPGYRGERIEDLFVTLGETEQLTFSLETSASGDEIVVIGSRVAGNDLAIGPNASFGLEALEEFPSISRDFRDIIRFDPRVSLDRANEVDRISCLGGNFRSNTFTVDGVVQADVVGLNSTPFAARNTQPLPFDSIAETSVEFAPFDVQYGQFTGCNINVVTKSGSNEFHGSAFANYAGSSLQGKSINGDRLDIEPFNDYNWGATLGGPVIKDRLFFFVAYEETDDADPQDDGPVGANLVNDLNFVTTAQADEISQILAGVYGVDTLGVARSLPQSSRRILTRWDWLLSDKHRLEFTYQRLRESNIEPDDFNNSQFTFLGTFEDEGTRSETYSARLFSQWTDSFSTELRASRADVQDLQGPVGGGEAQSDNPIPRFIVGVTNPFDVNGDGLIAPGEVASGTVLAGPGQFRSANDLRTQIDQIKALARYETGAHSLSAGYELNQLDLSNLFIQNATGTLFFSNIDNLRNGIINAGDEDFPDTSEILSGASVGANGSFTFSGIPADATNRFSRSVHSLYIQDEWRPIDPLTIVLGLRYDFYSGQGAPRENPEFFSRYGFTNALSFNDLDSLKAFLPRFGFTYDAPFKLFGETQIHGGAGVFTGGDATVSFVNAFTNSGNLIGFGSTATCTPAELAILDASGAFTGIPQCAVDAGAAQAGNSLADTQSTDPNLELPTVVRANFGFSTTTDFGGAAGGFFDGWRVDVDAIYSQFRNPFSFVDLAQTVNPALGVNGFTVDGRPIYRAIDPSVPGCNAELVGQGGTPPAYTSVTTECFATSRDDEIELTNSDGFGAYTLSAVFSKSFDYTTPLLNSTGHTRVSLGYAFTDANNRRDLTATQSTSQYDGTALFDRQNPGVATSNFETRHNVTLAVNLSQEFIKNHPTRLGFFFGARSGRPFSYTFDGSGDFSDSASGSDNALLYVPTGVDDPFLSPSSDPAAVAALDAFIAAEPCLASARGGAAPRNTCRNPWFFDLDLRFQQLLPVPGKFVEDRLSVFADIDNVLNLISDDRNIFRQRSSNVDLVDVSVDSAGRYLITDFNPDNQLFTGITSSVWAVQFGVRYEF